MFKIWLYPQQERVAGFTPTQQQSYLCQLRSAQCIFPSQTNLHTFFLNLFFPCPLQPPFPPLTFNLKIQCPSQNMTVLSPRLMTIPSDTVCHSQLIYGFTLTQHEHQICRSFSMFDQHSTHCSHHGSFCPL